MYICHRPSSSSYRRIPTKQTNPWREIHCLKRNDSFVMRETKYHQSVVFFADPGAGVVQVNVTTTFFVDVCLIILCSSQSQKCRHPINHNINQNSNTTSCSYIMYTQHTSTKASNFLRYEQRTHTHFSWDNSQRSSRGSTFSLFENIIDIFSIVASQSYL
jgi:hypothetical protein